MTNPPRFTPPQVSLEGGGVLVKLSMFMRSWGKPKAPPRHFQHPGCPKNEKWGPARWTQEWSWSWFGHRWQPKGPFRTKNTTTIPKIVNYYAVVFLLRPPKIYRRRTNVQQLACNINLCCSFYYLFFSFVLIELKPLFWMGKSWGKNLKKWGFRDRRARETPVRGGRDPESRGPETPHYS